MIKILKSIILCVCVLFLWGSSFSSVDAVSCTTPSGRLYGDINGDGDIDVSDGVLVQRHVLGLATLTGARLEAADVNGDGVVTSQDTELIMQYALGNIATFPVCYIDDLGDEEHYAYLGLEGCDPAFCRSCPGSNMLDCRFRYYIRDGLRAANDRRCWGVCPSGYVTVHSGPGTPAGSLQGMLECCCYAGTCYTALSGASSGCPCNNRVFCVDCGLKCEYCPVVQPTVQDSQLGGNLYTKSPVSSCSASFRCHGDRVLDPDTGACREYYASNSSTYDGSSRYYQKETSQCPRSETYYMKEHTESPSRPESISMRVDDGPYVRYASGELAPDGVRVPYPGENNGVDGTKFRVQALGAVNWREDDPHFRGNTHGSSPWVNRLNSYFVYDRSGTNHPHRHVTGNEPKLEYQYTLSLDNVQQGRSNWRESNMMSAYPNSLDWDVQLSSGLKQGVIYRVAAQARSINRCSGYTVGIDRLIRRFVVNNVPEVVSITPVTNPNDGVSGNINYDASKYSMSNTAQPFEQFNCTVDNPKVFEVVYEDADGCNDINPQGAIPTNIWVQRDRELGLRAVEDVANPNYIFEGKLLNDSLRCEGDKLISRFEVKFTGNVNVNLRLEAYVQDVLGNQSYDSSTGSNWVQPSSDAVWAYDGRRPNANIDVLEVTSPNEISLGWGTRDFANDLSGVRFIRTYARLNAGSILTDGDDYSSINYAGEVVPLNDNFGNYYEINLDRLALSVAQARQQRSQEYGQERKVNIGINNDGSLDFRILSVDRACNYTDSTENLSLGTPWVATRGGFVYSLGPINLSTPKVAYSNIGSGFGLGGEMTSVSTEWVASGGSISGNLDYGSGRAYSSTSYANEIALRGRLYDYFLEIAERRYPEGAGKWSFANSGELSSSQLSVCENNEHVYFVDGDLEVDPSKYENLGVKSGTGCIFIVKGNIVIGEGDYKSAGEIIETDIQCVTPAGRLYGDLDGNGTINSQDLTILQRYIFGLESLDIISRDAADLNGDKNFDVLDVTLLQRYLLGEINTFPVCSITSSVSPKYDLMRGFFIADGEINIEFADEGREIRDGLKVVGSLVAFDNPGGEAAIRLRRSLQLRDNLLHPTLIVFHDARYNGIARTILGDTLGSGHIRDVGFIE